MNKEKNLKLLLVPKFNAAVEEVELNIAFTQYLA